MSSDILQNGRLATAAWLDLEAAIKNFEAATLRGDLQTAQTFRQRAHDILDTHMDLKSDSMVTILKMQGRK